MRPGLRIMLRESFFPYLLFLILFFIFLLIVDGIIEKRSRQPIIITLAPLVEAEAPLRGPVVNRLDPKMYRESLRPDIENINNLIEKDSWEKAANLLKKTTEFGGDTGLATLLLGYVLYKSGATDNALATLATVDENKYPQVNFYKGLVLSEKKGNESIALQYYNTFIVSYPATYEGRINRGLLQLRIDDLDGARISFTEAAELTGGKHRANALFHKGRVELAAGNKSKAKSLFQEAINLAPAFIPPRKRFARILLDEDAANCTREMEKAISLDRSWVQGYYYLAKYYYEHKKLERAIQILKTGITMTGSSQQLLSYLGFIYLESDDFENAREVYTSLSNEYPKNELYFFNLARCYYGLGDYNNAVTSYKKALTLRPGYYKALQNMGITYARMKSYNDAINKYREALALEPESATTLYNIGMLYNRKSNYETAFLYFKKALVLKPDYAEAIFNMGYIENRRGNQNKALILYGQAINADKKYDLAYINSCLILSKMKKYDEAISLAKSGIEKTNSIKLSEFLANLYMKLNNPVEAEPVFLSIYEKEPDNTEALLGLGKISLEKNNYHSTLGYLRRYIYFLPRSVEGRYFYMIALYRSGNLKEAKNQFKIITTLKYGYRDIEEYRKLLEP